MTEESGTKEKMLLGIPPAEVLGQYRGQWVAFYHDEVLATGEDFGKVLDEARATVPGKEPTLMKVPSGELFIL